MNGFAGSLSELIVHDTDIARGRGTNPGELTAAGLRLTESLATACDESVPKQRHPAEQRLVQERRR